MKKAIIYSIVIFTASLFASGLKAQPLYLGEIRIIQNRFEQKGDSLYIEMNIDLNGLTVDNNQAFVLTPVIETQVEFEELPSVVVNGKTRAKAYRRSLDFNHGIPLFPTYTTVVVNHRTREKINYKVTVPYEVWMENAKLNLQENFCDCAGEKRLISVNMLAKSLVLEGKKEEVPEVVATPAPPPPPVVTEVKEVIKNIYYKEGSAYLDFPVNQTYILPDFRRNYAELAKIRSTLDSIIGNPHYEITGIYLTGYASPEGPYEENERLSRERTKALRDYLRNRYDFPADLYHVAWKGEDWEGLQQLIMENDMPSKQRVLNIIDNVDIFKGRERMLMDLNGGDCYRYMLVHFFPKLRRVDYQITYKIVK